MASKLEQENIFLKKMLNDYLENVYPYRDTEFDELKIKDLRNIHSASMQLV